MRPRCTRLSASHPYSVHLSNVRVNQYLHSFIPYTGKLWNSLPLFFHLPMTWILSKEEYQDTSNAKLDLHALLLFLLLSSLQGLATSGIFLMYFSCPLASTLVMKKRKKKKYVLCCFCATCVILQLILFIQTLVFVKQILHQHFFCVTYGLEYP